MNTAGQCQPQAGRQNLGDAELAYLRYAGEGPPLLLLHATGFQPWLWHPLAREWAHSYHILAPSICNHRPADPHDGGLSWVTLAKDIVRFCHALGIERPFLAGHSMGATVLMLSHALCGLPAAGLVLIEPILLTEEFYQRQLTPEQHPFAAKALKRTNFWPNRDEARSYLNGRSLFQGWDEEMVELYLEHGMSEAQNGGLQLACSPRSEAALFMGGARFDPWPWLPKVSCPVLLLEGEKSEMQELIDFNRIRSLLPVCDHRVIEQAGHMIPMERPGEVTRLIGDFFGPLREARTKSAVG
ncbi:MAG: alpha/beta hydrolase [Deltaproteobacteria bacterium]|nr:alpha/beta hydrolase [Deltaproteobacteria bacterium]